MREALFSILGSLEGQLVLDLYAGSGALGIEALSRGAASAVFVESEARAAEAIRGNLAAIGAGKEATLVRRDAIGWLGADCDPGVSFDLVFCDPPYDSAPDIAEPLSLLLPQVAAPEALIVTESAKRNPLELTLPLTDERFYGDTRIAIYRGS